MQKSNGTVPCEILDELGRAAIDQRPELWAAQQVALPHGFLDKPPKGFFDIAVLFGLNDYARVRLRTSTKAEAKHALEFSRGHRGMFLNHRKDDWLRDRKALSEAFGSTALHAELGSHMTLPFRKFFRFSAFN